MKKKFIFTIELTGNFDDTNLKRHEPDMSIGEAISNACDDIGVMDTLDALVKIAGRRISCTHVKEIDA